MKLFQQLKTELDKGQIQNFYVFTGEEREVLRKYIKRIDEKAETVNDFSTLWKKLFSRGLFNTGNRTYVLHNDKEIMNLTAKEIVKAVGSHTLILVYDSIDKRSKFFKQTEAFITEFEKYNEQQLASIVKKRFPNISTGLAQGIALCSNNEVSRLELEMDKLSYFKEITEDLLDDLMTFPLEDRIFDMIDLVAKRKSIEAFELYKDLIELKESPIKIVSLLYTKFKQMFIIQSYSGLSDKEITEKTGLNFYQLKYGKELIGYFTNEQLVSILKSIQETEVNMKTGKVDINLGMDTLLIDIFMK